MKTFSEERKKIQKKVDSGFASREVMSNFYGYDFDTVLKTGSFQQDPLIYN